MIEIFPEGTNAYLGRKYFTALSSTSKFRDQESEGQRIHDRMNVGISKPWSLTIVEKKKKIIKKHEFKKKLNKQQPVTTNL